MQITRTLAVVVCLALFSAAPTLAQEPALDGAGGQAASHFERGVELYREGSLDAALVEFERAYELSPNYRVLYNLGQIQAERHEYAAAVGLFQRYLMQGADEVPPERRGEVQQEIVKLSARVAHLSVASNVEGAKLFVNDTQVAILPLSEPIPINAGVWNVRLEKPGYTTATARLKVAGGERPTLELPLIAAGTRAQEREVAAGPGANYVPFWISAGTMLALGGATLGFGLVARTADHDLDAALRRVPADPAQINEERAQLKLYAGLTDGFAAASLLALGVATYFLLAPPHARAEPARTARFSPSTRGLGLRATF